MKSNKLSKILGFGKSSVQDNYDGVPQSKPEKRTHLNDKKAIGYEGADVLNLPDEERVTFPH